MKIKKRNGTIKNQNLSSDYYIAKILNTLRSQPSNRSCCDCRCALLDPQNVFVSVYRPGNNILLRESNVRKINIQDFHYTHRSFAPPNCKLYHDYGDPEISANDNFGGHCVFLCLKCAEAHRQLSMMKVTRVVDSSLWTSEEAQFIAKFDGNASCWRIYEAFVPVSWKKRRPIYSSSLSARSLFCRAKYEALAFCLPPPGPLAGRSWRIILRSVEEKNKTRGGKQPFAISTNANLKNIYSLSLLPSKTSDFNKNKSKRSRENGPPNRLFDYFCVISSSSQLLPTKSTKNRKSNKVADYSKSNLEDLKFSPHVTDWFPRKNTHGDMGYQDHISSFVMPNGCYPSLSKPPSFFTFVLTLSDGSYLYGGSLQIFDEHVDAEDIKSAMRDSGYRGGFPRFLNQGDNEVFFFPKCLVILSRYAFFDLFRSILTNLYEISVIGSKLPIERYITNLFEIPLPPMGQVKVEFGFSSEKRFYIERPPINELPMANFSYRPLFASLSVSNVIVVLGYMLQERKIVLLSKHYSMLTPVAEAFMSAIFPFRWVGLYIPVSPLKMIEILDAPVPYLIGLSSEYLKIVDVRKRPSDVVLVDLERDVVHIGNMPLPEIEVRDAEKLRISLEASGGSVYIMPNSGIKGCIMRRSLLLPNKNRPKYANMATLTDVNMQSQSRAPIFSFTDLAYGKFNDETDYVNGLESEDGRWTSMEQTVGSDVNEKKKGVFLHGTAVTKSKYIRNKKVDMLSNNHAALSQGHLLDISEPEGFSATDIRKAFLRFMVSMFADFLSTDRDLCDKKKLVDTVGSNVDSRHMSFLKIVAQTQLFQRFLEERKENPSLPEIRFFNESVVAKRNRSKKANLANGGKIRTPFLDDKTTWKIKKKFVPPPPNNLGLPGNQETHIYRYGKFPVLDEELFGRIRPPILWRQHINFDSVRMMSTKSDMKMKKTQNEVVKNVLTAHYAAARRTARDLESTLAALSIVPISKREDHEGKSFSERNVNIRTLSTAETIMIDARRKQNILMNIIIRFQAMCRGFLSRIRCNALKVKLLNCARVQMNNELKSVEKIRKQLADTHIKLHNSKVILIQSFVRMYQAEKKADQMLEAIINLQRVRRASIARQKFIAMKCIATVIAKYFRSRRSQMIFLELKRLLTIVQATVRGALVRINIKRLMQNKMSFYTRQIVLLWELLNVSFIFRMKLWPDISGAHNNFARLRVSESELVRLWGIAGFNNRLVMNTKSDRDETSKYNNYGICNSIYEESKLCLDWIDRCGQTYFDSSTGENTDLRIMEAERLQMYMRLDSSANMTENDILTMYHSFDISPNEKQKKICLCNKIWKNHDQCDLSLSLMKQIFPELNNSLCINFHKPSPKGNRRFPNALQEPPPPLDYAFLDKISIEGNRKRHVQEVAMLFITKIPSLTIRLDVRNKKRNIKFESYQDTVMKLYNFESLEKTRHFIFINYMNIR